MSPRLRWPLLLLAAWTLSPPPSAFAAAPKADADFFEAKVRPLLVQRCAKCHGLEAHKGKLRLDSAEGRRRGGESGAAVVPGKPEQSLLIQAVRHQGELKMPPGGKLSPHEIASLEAWVKAGASWPAGDAHPPATTPSAEKSFWACQPPRRAVPPVAPPGEVARSPIDLFLLAKLRAAGLKPNPPADRRALIRRVTFDLTGLPPNPEEVDDFLADDSPDAFARVVDRLLASPHYGERWGRHWLDVVRYGETTANDSNTVMRYAWRYGTMSSARSTPTDRMTASSSSSWPGTCSILSPLAPLSLPGS